MRSVRELPLIMRVCSPTAVKSLQATVLHTFCFFACFFEQS